MKRLAICQNEKGNWNEDLQTYLLMYRSTPHSTTLRTPAELMFNRNIRDKLPSFEQRREVDGELNDRNTEMKAKGKEYADRKRRAKMSEIEEGDTVVAKRQIKTNKLATTFEPTVYKVAKRTGSEITIENPATGTQYRRNVAHIKKVAPTEIATTSSPPVTSPQQQQVRLEPRPQRNRTAPARYKP